MRDCHCQPTNVPLLFSDKLPGAYLTLGFSQVRSPFRIDGAKKPDVIRFYVRYYFISLANARRLRWCRICIHIQYLLLMIVLSEGHCAQKGDVFVDCMILIWANNLSFGFFIKKIYFIKAIFNMVSSALDQLNFFVNLIRVRTYLFSHYIILAF